MTSPNNWIAQCADFRAYCRNATDAQLRNIYTKERKANRRKFAEIAYSVARERGIEI